MNAEKLAKLQAQVRIGGKGSQRRKKKVVHRSSATDDKKLQNSLKKLTVNNISGIEEVNMIKDDGSVIHFNNPKVQASLNANTFAVSGHAENKQITEMLPGILSHLGAEGFNQLKRLASSVNPALFSGAGALSAAGIDEDDDDVPELVEDFEAASKTETAAEKSSEPKKEEPKITELSNITADVPKIVEITEEPKVEEPVKTEETKPEPEPEPVKAAEPEPVKEAEPEPEPVKAAEPEPVKAAEPEPVKEPEPEPVKEAEPEPVKAAEAPAPAAEE